MLTGLKVSPLARKCVFYKPEHNAKGGSHELNFDGLKMQKWNIPMDRTQRVDEKNGVICLVMFTARVIVMKMSKMAHFLHFLLIPVVFFISLSSEGYLTSKYINHTIFWKNSTRSFRCSYIFCTSCG